jgi:hypothetical protein
MRSGTLHCLKLGYSADTTTSICHVGSIGRRAIRPFLERPEDREKLGAALFSYAFGSPGRLGRATGNRPE